RTVLAVRARQVAEAHQKLPDDLAAHEGEAALEELHPLFLGPRVMSVDPGGERAVLAADFLDHARVADRRIDLEAVADDARIAEKPGDVPLAERGDAADVPVGEGGAERLPLLQDREPGEPGLVDLEDEALEQHPLVGGVKAVLPIVIGPVERMPGSDVAIAHSGCRKVTRSLSTTSSTTPQRSAATTVVTAIFSARRGRAGAPLSAPGGASSPTGWTPQGSTAKSTIHQRTR